MTAESEAYQKECELEQELQLTKYQQVEQREECERLSCINAQMYAELNQNKVQRKIKTRCLNISIMTFHIFFIKCLELLVLNLKFHNILYFKHCDFVSETDSIG